LVLIIYIAGPIFGKPNRNETAFREMAAKVEHQLCATVLVPLDIAPWEHAGECPPGRRTDGETHNESCHMRTDLANMLTCDGIALLAGWQNSHGGRAELYVANVAQMSVYLEDRDGNLRKIS
jgi:hypothetical protein